MQILFLILARKKLHTKHKTDTAACTCAPGGCVGLRNRLGHNDMIFLLVLSLLLFMERFILSLSRSGMVHHVAYNLRFCAATNIFFYLMV